MLKWLLVTVVALVLLTACMPWLSRLGLGRLPGDFTLQWRGRTYPLPFTTTIVLSLLLALISRWI